MVTNSRFPRDRRGSDYDATGRFAASTVSTRSHVEAPSWANLPANMALPAIKPHEPRVLWLWWHGPEGTELDLVWRAYFRRFDLEHTLCFLKQNVGWTTPRVRHPEQADRRTWLVLAALTQLRLAHSCAADRRPPWERPQRGRRLIPCRTLRDFATLLAAVGTPMGAPKPCRRSPGRPEGRLSGRAKRYPALKKGAEPARKAKLPTVKSQAKGLAQAVEIDGVGPTCSPRSRRMLPPETKPGFRSAARRRGRHRYPPDPRIFWPIRARRGTASRPKPRGSRWCRPYCRRRAPRPGSRTGRRRGARTRARPRASR